MKSRMSWTQTETGCIFYSAHDRHTVWFLRKQTKQWKAWTTLQWRTARHGSQCCFLRVCDPLSLDLMKRSFSKKAIRFYYHTQSFTPKINFILQRRQSFQCLTVAYRIAEILIVCFCVPWHSICRWWFEPRTHKELKIIWVNVGKDRASSWHLTSPFLHTDGYGACTCRVAFTEL